MRKPKLKKFLYMKNPKKLVMIDAYSGKDASNKLGITLAEAQRYGRFLKRKPKRLDNIFY